MVGAACCHVVCLLGFILVPEAGFAWAVLFGLANGAMFAMLMTLPLDVARLPEQVGSVAAFMMGLGYTIAAVAPFGLGAIRDATGSFAATLWVIVASTLLTVLVCTRLSPGRLRRGVTLGRGRGPRT